VNFESSGEGQITLFGSLVRLYHSHSLLVGVAMLRRILVAYSMHNPKVGYWYEMSRFRDDWSLMFDIRFVVKV
jgi:hypothetical protein